MREIKRLLFGAYLGFSLSVCGISFLTWQFYFIVIPTIFLVVFVREGDL